MDRLFGPHNMMTWRRLACLLRPDRHTLRASAPPGLAHARSPAIRRTTSGQACSEVRRRVRPAALSVNIAPVDLLLVSSQGQCSYPAGKKLLSTTHDGLWRLYAAALKDRGVGSRGIGTQRGWLVRAFHPGAPWPGTPCSARWNRCAHSAKSTARRRREGLRLLPRATMTRRSRCRSKGCRSSDDD